MSRRQSQLHPEMEITNNTEKMTPEERRRYLRKEMFKELREIEMQRRRSVALEEFLKSRKEKEERDKEAERLKRQKERVEEERRRQEAKQREEEERRQKHQKALEKDKQKQLKKERLRWRKIMTVEEEPITRPRFTLSGLKKEQQRRREEAELRGEQDKADWKCLISALKSQEQSSPRTLINNWVGEQQETHCETLQEELHPPDSTLRPSVEKTSLKSPATSKSSKGLQWLQETLRSGLSFRRNQDEDEVERKRLRELHGKNKRCSRLSEQIDGYHMSRNSILKKSIS